METRPFKNWWFLLVNGVISLLFGLVFILYSQDSIKALIMYFGIFILAAGLLLLIIALINLKKNKHFIMQMIQCVTSIGLGAFLLFSPENSIVIFQLLIGVWNIIIGIIQLVILVNIRQNLTNKNVFLFNGLMTIAMGIIMFFYPLSFAMVVIKIIGLFAMFFGIILIYLSFIIRKVARSVDTE